MTFVFEDTDEYDTKRDNVAVEINNLLSSDSKEEKPTSNKRPGLPMMSTTTQTEASIPEGYSWCHRDLARQCKPADSCTGASWDDKDGPS